MVTHKPMIYLKFGFFSLFPQIFCITRKDELMKNCPKVNKSKREQIELIIGIPHEC